MPPTAHYKLIVGNELHMNQQLLVLAETGWKPILMSATTARNVVSINVILENTAPVGNRINPINPPPG